VTRDLLLRLNEVAGLLAIHGVLTPGERVKVHHRLMKLKEKLDAADGKQAAGDDRPGADPRDDDQG
jgi:hypothetical protein